MLRRAFIFAFICLFVSSAATAHFPARAAQSGAAAEQPSFAELEKFILEEIGRRNVPGAAVAVVSGDRVIFARGLGVSNVETGAPVTTDMLFRLGSTTKMFVAAALVSLAEQGKVKLDEPAGKYVKGLNEKVGRVTAHQLLSHTAGIRDEAPMYGSADDAALRNGVLAWKEDYLFTEPGRIISYSNPGYWLAGAIIEEASGRPFADQMSEGLFKPLGMNSTTFRPTMAMTYPLAQGHNASPGQKPAVIRPMADNAATWPAGSMFSSVSDLSRFVIAFLNGGRVDGKQVLSESLIAKISTPYAAVPTSPDNKYAYGLMTSNYRGVRVIEHGGSRVGYGSVIKLAPDQRFGVIVLANRSGVMLDRVADKAMELMLRLAPANEEAEKELPMSQSEMAGYVGLYAQGRVYYELFVKEGKLFGKQGTVEGQVKKIGDNRFVLIAQGGRQQFALVPGENGKAEYLHTSLRSARRVE
jgi:CubicO group peptidase (beta-lactamase class C family)